jgi:hypothetical protein
MSNSDDESERQRQALIRILQTELPPTEPSTAVREALLKRILERTVRTWREWTKGPENGLDD